MSSYYVTFLSARVGQGLRFQIQGPKKVNPKERVNITWNLSPENQVAYPFEKIELCRGKLFGSSCTTLIASAPNTGSATVVIPADYKPGQVYLRLTARNVDNVLLPGKSSRFALKVEALPPPSQPQNNSQPTEEPSAPTATPTPIQTPMPSGCGGAGCPTPTATPTSVPPATPVPTTTSTPTPSVSPTPVPGCLAAPTPCPSAGVPVCGTDGRDYPNSCYAKVAGVPIQGEGYCLCSATVCGRNSPLGCSTQPAVNGFPPSCSSMPAPVSTCPTTDRPVCGLKGVTYANACFAIFAGDKIAHDGVCSLATPRSTICPDDLVATPVCGTNNVTYASECLANQYCVPVSYKGACSSPYITIAKPAKDSHAAYGSFVANMQRALGGMVLGSGDVQVSCGDLTVDGTPVTLTLPTPGPGEPQPSCGAQGCDYKLPSCSQLEESHNCAKGFWPECVEYL